MPGDFEVFGRAVDRCESYIERRFLVALLFSEEFTFTPVRDGTGGLAVDRFGVVLGQQVPAGPYSLDFAMKRRGADARVNIELDGHRYHDASPEKAQKDRARDRMLVALGWRIVRFTGREIIQDALGCARQAHRLMLSVAPAQSPAPLVKTGGQLSLPARAAG